MARSLTATLFEKKTFTGVGEHFLGSWEARRTPRILEIVPIHIPQRPGTEVGCSEKPFNWTILEFQFLLLLSGDNGICAIVIVLCHTHPGIRCDNIDSQTSFCAQAQGKFLSCVDVSIEQKMLARLSDSSGTLLHTELNKPSGILRAVLLVYGAHDQVDESKFQALTLGGWIVSWPDMVTIGAAAAAAAAAAVVGVGVGCGPPLQPWQPPLEREATS